jgi:hypothetical protein
MKNKNPDMHLKTRETVMQTYSGAFYVDVTSCGWVNPPKDRVTSEMGEVSCEQCLEHHSAVVS